MTYQVVKDAQGKIVAVGPDDGMYEPTLRAGEVLSIENKFPESHIKDLAIAETNRKATITAARAHASSLGYTDTMLDVMYPNLAP